MNNSIAEGAVAVHRWFADGEGWAAHPTLAWRLNDVADVAAHLLNSAAGDFVAPALGGFLVGLRVADPNCLDPKARDRHPTIVHMAFLADQPSREYCRELVAKLRELPLPTRAGVDARLMLPGFAQATDWVRAARGSNRRFVWAGAAGAAAICLAVVAWALTRPGAEANGVTPNPHRVQPDDENKPKADHRAAGSDADLTPIEGELPYLNDRTRTEFRRKWEAVKMYDHPYVAFLDAWADQLPASAPKCNTPDEVRAGLRGLLGHLRPGSAVDDMSAVQLRDSIEQVLNYESWRVKVSRRFIDNSKPLPDAVRRFVHAFHRPDSELQGLTKRMAELLEQWGESGAKVEQERSPFSTIDRFFAVLTRPAKLPSAAKVDHPKVVFQARLPTEPIDEGRTFDDVESLAKSLRRLLFLLDEETDPHAKVSRLDTLNRIAEQMRYTDWSAKRSKQSFRDGAMHLPEVERTCRRFE